ncbi:SpaA isopeptide-forming pilin-related protein [Enterococcus hirae]|uniref:SpaA isopeptide-forming pilin-related protein n=3 Tax=Enterococcus hirae TaxID=1354 RepID=UPI001F058961|nr:LPXTG cell wall anchor domain-containing protein [Enterococcus hirae]
MKKYQLVVRIFLIIHLLSVSFCRPLVVLAGNLENTDQDDRKISFLQENQLIQTEDGKLYTTTPSNYITHSIHAALGETQTHQRNNQTIYVDPNAHISNIDIRLSNGVREYGWYGKRINNEIALCIEPGAALNLGNNSGYTVAERNTEQMKKISLIKYYGLMVSGHTLKKELMTQILAWEQQGITPLSISGVFSMTDYQTFKSAVMKNVNYFYTSPSFDKQTIALKVGESITLTDTTHAFSNYQSLPSFVSQGLSISKKGNQLTILANKNAEATSRVEFDYDIASTFQGVPLIYQHPYTQNMMVGRLNERKKISLTITVLKNGNARVRKVDETTKQPLAGAVFRFTTSDGKTKEITTGSDGYATWNDLLVDTKVTIQEIKAPNGYVLNATPQTVTIKANETTTISLDNKEQLANLKVIKEDEETGSKPQGASQLVGAVYELTDKNGTSVSKLTMQDVNGIAQAEVKGLKLGTYYLQEIEPPEGYNLDATKHTVNLTYAGQNETVALHSKTVTDRVIKGNVEGYKFGSRPLIPQTVFEVIARLKKEQQGVKPPLEGVELTATSHTTGQEYVQVTGKNGYFKFENLPYDTYTIEETQGVDGYLLIEPFEVTITEDGYTHFFLLEDKVIESRLHIVKVDEETGENIPYAGAQFKIFDTWANEGEGEFVSMVRPNDTEQTEIFETNDKGEIITTESLPWGVDRYELHEIKAPEGYVPLEEPLIFSVTEENADALIRLEIPNRLARQDIQLIKRDRLNEQPLENVPFHLYNIATDENGELTEILVEKYLTDKEGKINVEALPYGNYKFVEVEPLAGYLPLEEPMDFSVTVEKDGELLVLEAYNEREPLELTSLFTDIAGEKTLDPTVDNQLKDVVWVKGEAIEIGHTYTVFTQYKNTKTGEVVSESTSTYTAKSKEDTFEVFLELKANILKDGDQLTATHVLYYEEEQKNEVGREDDLRNKDQTITLKKEKLLLKQSILPKTNERHSLEMVLLGLSLIIIVSSYLYLQKKQKHVKL